MKHARIAFEMVHCPGDELRCTYRLALNHLGESAASAIPVVRMRMRILPEECPNALRSTYLINPHHHPSSHPSHAMVGLVSMCCRDSTAFQTAHLPKRNPSVNVPDVRVLDRHTAVCSSASPAVLRIDHHCIEGGKKSDIPVSLLAAVF